MQTAQKGLFFTSVTRYKVEKIWDFTYITALYFKWIYVKNAL